MKHSSMAVQLYLGMPAFVRRSFAPSMFKVRLDDDGQALKGGDRRKGLATCWQVSPFRRRQQAGSADYDYLLLLRLSLDGSLTSSID